MRWTRQADVSHRQDIVVGFVILLIADQSAKYLLSAVGTFRCFGEGNLDKAKTSLNYVVDSQNYGFADILLNIL